ncbi:MAG: lipid-A-disaccharide synthase [Bacteroidales bacterium]|nr:lipid-A-disaccharide synthase [Bacteroidales bacterium]MDD4822350.1 lipid-A-disaccharide synthase [Bacteroidales bacterium]
MKYYLIAGEASGDLHASHLMAALKKRDHQAEFRFFGGDMMAAQGGQLIKHYRELAYMGFIPVISHLPTILNNIRKCKKDISLFNPDVVILVDYPGFNMKIAQYVKTRLSIPVYYYISPKIWAWKEYRIKSVKRYVDRMYSILPFEVEFYKKHGYEIEYVGNPSVDEVSAYQSLPKEPVSSFQKRNQLSDKPIIALLAGSRKQEIEANLNHMLSVVDLFPDFQFVIAGAPGIDESFYQAQIKNESCRIVFGQTYPLLQQSTAALVTSGTATLETALFDVPQIVCYSFSMPPVLYRILRPLIKVPFISLVNLIAGKEVCKELLGFMITRERLQTELNEIIYNREARNQMLQGYAEMKNRLGGPGAPERAAESLINSLKR